MAELVRFNIHPGGQVELHYADRDLWIRAGCCRDCTLRINNHPEVVEALRTYVEPRQFTMDERLAAEAKARKLLISLLPAKAQLQFRKHGWFSFKSEFGNTYRIRSGYSGNITEMAGRVPLRQYCCHLGEASPISDHMIAQYLCLKYNEAHFQNTTF